MPPVVFLVPGSLATRTGGYIYDRRMIDGLRQRGWPVEVHELDDSFPRPTGAALAHAACVLAAVRDGACVLVDGLAFGAMPANIEREAARLRLVALVHLPLGADVALDRETAARLAAGERRALAAAALVVVTGMATLSMLADSAIPRDRIVVVEPGTDMPLAPRHAREVRTRPQASGDPPVRLLSVATLNPGKGHEILLQALATLDHRDWHLTCAGSLTRHPATVDRVRAAIRRLNLDDRVSLRGELDAASLADCYDNADLFVLATLRETYGMAVAEALAYGLPVVGTTTGAIAGLVGNDAGLLVPPGDADALAGALARVVGDDALRARLADGAHRARCRLRSWEQAVEEMAAALRHAAEPSHG